MTDLLLLASMGTIIANITITGFHAYVAYRRWKAEKALVAVEMKKLDHYKELQRLKRTVARLKRK